MYLTRAGRVCRWRFAGADWVAHAVHRILLSFPSSHATHHTPQQTPIQQLHPSAAAAMVEVTPEVRRRNRLVALACVAFAFSVYSYSIRQLKQVGFVLCLETGVDGYFGT